MRDGSEDAKGCEKMAETVFSWTKKNFKDTNIVVCGYSIGTGPAAYVANLHQDEIYGLVLVNPFKSIWHLAYDFTGLLAGLVRQRFPTHRRLMTYKNRLIIICGKNDEIIPFTHSLSLHALCKSSSKKIIVYQDMGHQVDDWSERVIKPVCKAWFSPK